MLLSVLERITLLNILPPTVHLTERKIYFALQDALGFSEEEQAALKFQNVGNQTQWVRAADIPKEVEIGPIAMRIMQDGWKATIPQAEQDGGLTPAQMKLAERCGVDLDAIAAEIEKRAAAEAASKEKAEAKDA